MSVSLVNHTGILDFFFSFSHFMDFKPITESMRKTVVAVQLELRLYISRDIKCVAIKELAFVDEEDSTIR